MKGTIEEHRDSGSLIEDKGNQIIQSVENRVLFVPDYLKFNSYRLLRLPTKSAYSEIHKASLSIKRSVQLGILAPSESDIPLLGDVSRTEADIQAAIA